MSEAADAGTEAAGGRRVGDSIVLDSLYGPNYNPTAQEILDYAKWLDLDPEEDKDLFWVAEQGLKAPLPEHWSACQQAHNQEVYFFNFATGESLWDHPLDEHYKDLARKAKAEKAQKTADRAKLAASLGVPATTSSTVTDASIPSLSLPSSKPPLAPIPSTAPANTSLTSETSVISVSEDADAAEEGADKLAVPKKKTKKIVIVKTKRRKSTTSDVEGEDTGSTAADGDGLNATIRPSSADGDGLNATIRPSSAAGESRTSKVSDSSVTVPDSPPALPVVAASKVDFSGKPPLKPIGGDAVGIKGLRRESVTFDDKIDTKSPPPTPPSTPPASPKASPVTLTSPNHVQTTAMSDPSTAASADARIAELAILRRRLESTTAALTTAQRDAASARQSAATATAASEEATRKAAHAEHTIIELTTRAERSEALLQKTRLEFTEKVDKAKADAARLGELLEERDALISSRTSELEELKAKLRSTEAKSRGQATTMKDLETQVAALKKSAESVDVAEALSQSLLIATNNYANAVSEALSSSASIAPAWQPFNTPDLAPFVPIQSAVLNIVRDLWSHSKRSGAAYAPDPGLVTPRGPADSGNNSALTKRLETAEAQLREIRLEKARLQRRITSLTEELDSVRATNSSASSITAPDDKVVKLQNDVAELERRLLLERNKVQRAEASCEALREAAADGSAHSSADHSSLTIAELRSKLLIAEGQLETTQAEKQKAAARYKELRNAETAWESKWRRREAEFTAERTAERKRFDEQLAEQAESLKLASDRIQSMHRDDRHALEAELRAAQMQLLAPELHDSCRAQIAALKDTISMTSAGFKTPRPRGSPETSHAHTQSRFDHDASDSRLGSVLAECSALRERLTEADAGREEAQRQVASLRVQIARERAAIACDSVAICNTPRENIATAASEVREEFAQAFEKFVASQKAELDDKIGAEQARSAQKMRVTINAIQEKLRRDLASLDNSPEVVAAQQRVASARRAKEMELEAAISEINSHASMSLVQYKSKRESELAAEIAEVDRLHRAKISDLRLKFDKELETLIRQHNEALSEETIQVTHFSEKRFRSLRAAVSEAEAAAQSDLLDLRARLEMEQKNVIGQAERDLEQRLGQLASIYQSRDAAALHADATSLEHKNLSDTTSKRLDNQRECLEQRTADSMQRLADMHEAAINRAKDAVARSTADVMSHARDAIAVASVPQTPADASAGETRRLREDIAEAWGPRDEKVCDVVPATVSGDSKIEELRRRRIALADAAEHLKRDLDDVKVNCTSESEIKETEELLKGIDGRIDAHERAMSGPLDPAPSIVPPLPLSKLRQLSPRGGLSSPVRSHLSPRVSGESRLENLYRKWSNVLGTVGTPRDTTSNSYRDPHVLHFQSNLKRWMEEKQRPSAA